MRYKLFDKICTTFFFADMASATPGNALHALADAVLHQESTPVALHTPVTALHTPETPKSDTVWRKMCCFRVKTNFTVGKQANIAIRPKHKGMQIVFPAALNMNVKARLCLTLPTAEPFGISPDFGKFLLKHLQKEVHKWKTLRSARVWVKNERTTWRTKVQNLWVKAKRVHAAVKKKRQQTRESVEALATMKRKAPEAEGARAKRTKRRLPLASPVYKSKKAGTYDIPVPDFEELMVGHTLGLNVALHVYSRKFSGSRKDHGMVCMPAQLAPPSATGEKRRSKEYSLGTEFGADPGWLRYVAEYLGYVADKWKTLMQARKWVSTYWPTFLEMLKEMYTDLKDRDLPRKDRMWRIAKSTVEFDPVYVQAFKEGKKWGFDPDAPKGSGLFCTKKGRHTIYMSGPKSVSEVTTQPKNSQSGYIAEFDADEGSVYTPTVMALIVGAVNHGFIVQHSSDDPTHEGDFCTIRNLPVLRPLREADEGEEFTFNYHYDKKGKRDIECDADTFEDLMHVNASTTSNFDI